MDSSQLYAAMDKQSHTTPILVELNSCNVGDYILPIYDAVRQGDEMSQNAKAAAAVAAAVAEMEKEDKLETLNPLNLPPPGYSGSSTSIQSPIPQQQTNYNLPISTILNAPEPNPFPDPEEVLYVMRKRQCFINNLFVGVRSSCSFSMQMLAGCAGICCGDLCGEIVLACISNFLFTLIPIFFWYMSITSFFYCLCSSRNRTIEVESVKAILTPNHFIIRYEEFNPSNLNCPIVIDDSTVCCFKHERKDIKLGTHFSHLQLVEIETCCCIESLNVYTGNKEKSCCGCDDPDMQLICMENSLALRRELINGRNKVRESMGPRHPAYELISGKAK